MAVSLDAGMVTRRADGWVVSSNNLNGEALASVVKTNADYTLRKIHELTTLGLDPATVSDRYLPGRPPLVED